MAGAARAPAEGEAYMPPHGMQSNRLWAGGRECGLFLYDGSVWRELLFNGSPVPGWITSLQFRGNDELWIGTAEQGIFRIALQGIL